MKVIDVIKQIRWRIPVYTCWFTVLSKILLTGEYSSFLRKEFAYIVALGALSLLVFMLSACAADSAHQYMNKGILHIAIMLLPLFYYLNAQGAFLGEQAYDKRNAGLPTIGAVAGNGDRQHNDDLPVLPQDEGTSQGVSASNFEVYTLPPEIDTGDEELTILDLYDTPEEFIGKTVTVTGMFHKDDERIINDFGRNIPIIYRFVITCCAADALPIAMLLDSLDSSNFEEGDWVEVQGIFTPITKDGDTIPMLLKPAIKKIIAPQAPYLY